MMIPNRVLVAAAVEKLLPSASLMEAAVLPSVTVMVAMIRTLAASTMMVTAPGATFATSAMLCCKSEVSA